MAQYRIAIIRTPDGYKWGWSVRGQKRISFVDNDSSFRNLLDYTETQWYNDTNKRYNFYLVQHTIKFRKEEVEVAWDIEIKEKL